MSTIQVYKAHKQEKIIAATTLPRCTNKGHRHHMHLSKHSFTNSCMIIVDMLINSIELSSSAATDVGMSLLLVY